MAAAAHFCQILQEEEKKTTNYLNKHITGESLVIKKKSYIH